jgi:murein DD-endopeptidase MepM/ murein hydrolase activator NlpD
MAKNGDKRSLLERFKSKYRLSVYRGESYQEVLNLKLSRLNVITIIGAITLIFLVIVVSIIAYTPVRELIPGYPDEKTLRDIRMNYILLDSLAQEIEKRDRYFTNLNQIISGREPDNYDNMVDTNISYENITFTKSSEDSLLRSLIEQEDQFSLSIVDNKKQISSVSKVHFFAPIKGIVTNSFNSLNNHYGTDIVAAPNQVVKAVLDGTITMATWTLDLGWIIQIQHENDLLSLYAHNAELLKKSGEYVKAGEPIAIIGNSGELTTGPHLHFELWHNGTPLNPEDFIFF